MGLLGVEQKVEHVGDAPERAEEHQRKADGDLLTLQGVRVLGVDGKRQCHEDSDLDCPQDHPEQQAFHNFLQVVIVDVHPAKLQDKQYQHNNTKKSILIIRYNADMPELPEVETVRVGLQEFLTGQAVKSVDCDWPKSLLVERSVVESKLIGAMIESVNRRGKLIIIPLSSGYSMLIHLKMTGQLVYRPNTGKGFGGGHPNDSLIDKLPDKSTRVVIKLTNGTLFFNDQRKFGWVKLEPTKDLEKNNAFLLKLGPEPLEDSYSFEQLKTAIQRRSKTSIKAAILDQAVLAGVGNIYADEALFAARIHPATKVGQVSTIKLKRLYNAIREVMKLSISLGGSSDRNYVDAKGNKGSYLKFAKVFRREGQTCPICGTEIVKIRVAGRGTHICPRCQRLPKVAKTLLK